MEFSEFLKELKFEDIHTLGLEKIVAQFAEHCEKENDFIQLEELRSILGVVDIFSHIYNAYLDCEAGSSELLFEEIERLSNMLEENGISCYSYSYYMSLFLYQLYHYDSSSANVDKVLSDLEAPEKMEWISPKDFNYEKVGSTTFGVNLTKQTCLTDSFPDYNHFVIEGHSLVGYKGKRSYVVIPDTVSEICATAFKDNKHIKMVIIPDSVISIEDGAFAGCEGLSLIHISKQIRKIPSNCFSGCKHLKFIIGDSIVEVGDGAFEMCTGLTEINLDKLTSVGANAFYGCKNLNVENIVSNLSHIGDGAFVSCKIQSLFLNDCESLGSNAFAGCKDITEVIINNDISVVGESPLRGCLGISLIDIRSAISFRLFDLFATSDEDFESFEYNLSSIKLVTLTPYICAGLNTTKEVVVSSNTSDIPVGAFAGCSTLSRIDFANRVIRNIEDKAFENCSALPTLDIDYTGTQIGTSSFYNCSSIRDFGFLRNVEDFGAKCLAYTNLSNFDFLNNKFKNIGAFAFANAYFPENLNIRFDGVSVSAGAFHGVEKINYLEIKNSNLDKQYIYALFEKSKKDFCNNVKINSLVTDYVADTGLFEGFDCSFIECNLDSAVIPDELFAGCTSLVSVKLNGKIEAFGDSSFMDCKSLEVVDIDVDGELVVGESAFMNCRNYTYPYFSQTKIIKDYAFYHSNITELKLGDNITYIGESAFGHCNISSSVELPFVGNDADSNEPFGIIFAQEMVDNTVVQTLDDRNFFIPNQISHVVIRGNRVSSEAFKNCQCITSVELSNIEQLTTPVFYGCSSLSSLLLGENLNSFSAESVIGVSCDINIQIPNNKYFDVVDNSVFSKDKKILYFTPNKVVPYASVYKSYSALYTSAESLVLDGVEKIEQYAFSLGSVKNLEIKDVKDIAEEAFIRCDELDAISISSKAFRDYQCIFSTEGDDLSLSQITLSNVSIREIKSLYNDVCHLEVDDLYLDNCMLEENTFEGMQINNLHIQSCRGSAVLHNNISNVESVHSSPLHELFTGEYSFSTVSITKDHITFDDILQISAPYVVLNNIKTICANAFMGSAIQRLEICGVDWIEPGAFYRSNIASISISKSDYYCDGCCISKEKDLLYYRPNTKSVSIPEFVDTICKHSVDLRNVTVLDIARNITFEEESLYNAFNLKKVSCIKYNLDRLSTIFDNNTNVTGLKEIVFEGDTVPEKYLSDLSTVESIALSQNTKSVCDFAFANDTSLKTVINIDNVDNYGDFIFSECSSLSKLVINSNAKYIGYGLFDGCVALKQVEMPILECFEELDNVISDILSENIPAITVKISSGNIYKDMFKDSPHSIVIPYSPKIIADNAFESVGEVSINLVETEKIGANAFRNTQLNKNIVLKACQNIGDSAFASCRGIRDITLSDKLQNIGEGAFANTPLESISITKNSKYRVEQNCLFENNDIIYYVPNSRGAEIDIDRKVSKIATNAFANAVNLKVIRFKSVDEIEQNSFVNCKRLSSVDLGEKEIDVTGAIFNGCIALNTLALPKVKQGKNKCLSDYFATNQEVLTIHTLHIVGSELVRGELDCTNAITTIRLSDKVDSIPVGYFKHCTALMSINIPNKCTTIEADAFNGCSNLVQLSVYDSSVTTFGDRALANTGITDIAFGPKVQAFGKKLLEGTPVCRVSVDVGLLDFDCETFGIGDALQEIAFNKVSFASRAFMNKSNLHSVIVKEYVSDEIPRDCFSGCIVLANISIPDTYSKIATGAFRDCVSIRKFYVSESVTVEKLAFENCNGVEDFVYNCRHEKFTLSYFGFGPKDSMLQSVILKNVTLAESAFEGFSSLKTVAIENVQSVIPSQAFYNCTGLQKVIISGFDSIEKSAFENCNQLASFNFMNCASVADDSFKNCSSLKEMVIPNSVIYLNKAFCGCTGVVKIIFNNEIVGFKLTDYGFEPSMGLREVSIQKCTFESSAFEGFSNLQKLQVEQPVPNIPENCFRDCVSLSINNKFFNSIESVSSKAFYGCEKIETCDFTNIKTLDSCAFENCLGLRIVTLGDGITKIPENAFKGCTQLKVVGGCFGIEEIDNFAFAQTNLRELNLYAGIKFVGSMIFRDNQHSVLVNIPNIDISGWATDWDKGFVMKHKFWKNLNPKVKLKRRR